MLRDRFEDIGDARHGGHGAFKVGIEAQADGGIDGRPQGGGLEGMRALGGQIEDVRGDL